MKKIITAILCALSISATAQITIEGKVIDQNGRPVDLAFINIIAGDSLAARCYTDQSGKFYNEAPNGQIHFQIGYFQLTGLDTIINIDKSTNLGNIKINTDRELSQVSIEAKRPILTQKPDRMVYNVEFDIFAQGRNVLDVMARAPRIKVNKQQKTIEMIGRDGVKIMLNDRILDDKTAETLIQSLTASDIAAIEIIPIPPSRYEATGNFGMINIVTKKQPNQGVSGNASVESAFWKNQYTIAPNLSLNFRSKKIEARVSASTDIDKFNSDSYAEYQYGDSTMRREQHDHGPDREFSTNDIIKYFPTDKIEIGALFNYSKYTSSSNDYGTAKMSGSKHDFTEYTDSEYETANNELTFTAYTDFILSTDKKKLSLTYNTTQKDMDIDNKMHYQSSGVNTMTPMHWENNYDVHNILADLLLPFGKAKVETGISGLFISNKNDVTDISSDNFKYTENTFAAYASIEYTISQKVQGKVGLRYENASVDGTLRDYGTAAGKRYNDFFPSFFLAYNPNGDNRFSASYARRIRRPSFSNINPFRIYSDANSYFVGNPNINPQYIHNFEVSYSWGELFVNSWLELSRGSIGSVKRITEDMLEENKIQNTYNDNYWGLGINYDWDITDWWELSAYTNVKYRSIHGYKPEFGIKSIEKWGSEFNFTSDTYLNPDQTIYLELYLLHDFPAIGYGGGENHNMGTFDVSLNFELLDGNLDISLYACDIFNQNFSRHTTYYENYKYLYSYFPFSQSFGLDINYRFGKTTVRDVNKRTKNDLKGRAQ